MNSTTLSSAAAWSIISNIDIEKVTDELMANGRYFQCPGVRRDLPLPVLYHIFCSIGSFAWAKCNQGPMLQIHFVLLYWPFPLLSYTCLYDTVFSCKYVKYAVLIHKYPLFALIRNIVKVTNQNSWWFSRFHTKNGQKQQFLTLDISSEIASPFSKFMI